MYGRNQKIIRHKVGLLNVAGELGNVSKACPVTGLSRVAATFTLQCVVSKACPVTGLSRDTF